MLINNLCLLTVHPGPTRIHLPTSTLGAPALLTPPHPRHSHPHPAGPPCTPAPAWHPALECVREAALRDPGFLCSPFPLRPPLSPCFPSLWGGAGVTEGLVREARPAAERRRPGGRGRRAPRPKKMECERRGGGLQQEQERLGPWGSRARVCPEPSRDMGEPQCPAAGWGHCPWQALT